MLMKPQMTDSTSTRLLQILEKYTERAILGTNGNQRQTYRVLALEMWNVQNSTEVNGIRYLQVDEPPAGATQEFDWFSNQTFKTRIVSDEDEDDDDNDINNVDVSISLPPSLIQDRLKASQAKGENLRMSFIVQRLDVLFSGQPSSDNTSVVGSLIVSASLGNEKIENLAEDQQIRTIFFVNQTKTGTPRCVFWDFALHGGKGGWSGRGCTLLNITGKEGYYECSCNHLTNFAVLIDYGGKIDEVHNTALTVITIIGLSLSIIGLSLTVITFLLFRKLRKGNNQKTLFNLALALLAAWILFLVGIILTQENLHSQVGCLVVAVLLHYFLLAGFMWMLVEAVLQYLRFVKILGTYIPYFIIKASFIAWGVPLIPVIVVLSINYNLYYRAEGMNITKFCWMDQYTSYFAFLLPIGLIILVNLVVFALIIWTICTRPKGLQTNQSKTKSAMVSLQAGIACFVLLGLTWIFGFLAIENARLVFQYIFTVLNSFHGFFIFLFFTLREKKVRQQWRALCCKKTERQRPYVSSEMYSNSNKHSGSDDTTSNFTSQMVIDNGGKFQRINSSGESVETNKPTQESMSFMSNRYKH
ncbi:adhesion G-protein coupled receptor G6-like [Liolophura sinensis]|uniref:adhesion G-protein coupled receptor G6-like n=1 Tax=Liolophura sinensis TaxID=3198878 RepID=UPI003159944C